MIPAPRRKQSGVALLTALLIVALVTMAAVAMTSRQQLDIRRTGNVLQRDQAYVYAIGAEVMAREVLMKDDAKVDDKDEDWAKSGITIPFEGGLLSATLEDLQGRFNINNLVNGGVVSHWDVERFKRLLQILKEQSEDRETWNNAEPADLANAVVDWIDTDSEPLPGGAEDNDYLLRERPYRAANTLITSTTELLLVRGFTTAIYREVVPYVTALPTRTKINANTAKPEVLRALGEDTACVDVNKLHRPEGSPVTGVQAELTSVQPTIFNKVDDFLQNNATAGCIFVGIRDKKKHNSAGAAADTPESGTAGDASQQHGGATNDDKVEPDEVLSVNSAYFQVNAYAEVGAEDHRIKVKVFSVLQRTGNKVAALSRAQGFE